MTNISHMVTHLLLDMGCRNQQILESVHQTNKQCRNKYSRSKTEGWSVVLWMRANQAYTQINYWMISVVSYIWMWSADDDRKTNCKCQFINTALTWHLMCGCWSADNVDQTQCAPITDQLSNYFCQPHWMRPVICGWVWVTVINWKSSIA